LRIVIRTFGLPREVLESDWIDVELPSNASVADLFTKLDADYPELFGMRGLAMYVNGKNVTSEDILHDGDQVFCAPIIAGG